MVEVEAKHSVLLKSLEKFYDEPALVTLRNALSGEHKISLRVLDWLVTNYAKKRNIVYQTCVNGRDVTFNMYLEYKSQLKAYSKRHFDPFSRRERVWFHGVKTTCGQLNFFRWAMQYGVLDFAREHHDAIERDMLDSTEHRHATTAKPGKTTRRKELSKAAIKTCTTTKVKVVVKFN